MLTLFIFTSCIFNSYLRYSTRSRTQPFPSLECWLDISVSTSWISNWTFVLQPHYEHCLSPPLYTLGEYWPYLIFYFLHIQMSCRHSPSTLLRTQPSTRSNADLINLFLLLSFSTTLPSQPCSEHNISPLLQILHCRVLISLNCYYFLHFQLSLLLTTLLRTEPLFALVNPWRVLTSVSISSIFKSLLLTALLKTKPFLSLLNP